MNRDNQKAFPGARSLDTLAQTGTKTATEVKPKRKRTVYGEGSDLSNNEALLSRTRRKFITQKVALGLITIAEKEGNTELAKKLWNMYFCGQEVITSGKRLYTLYCKNRLCSVCAGIRKAEKIRRYLPIIQQWERPYFVTLTAKALPAKNLIRRMSDINRGLRIIVERHRKRTQRGNGTRLVGIKSLECNFNPVRRTYNPHLHLIVENEEMAKTIISEWLVLLTSKFASPKAQLAKEISDREITLVEVVKYSTKLLTEPDPNKKSKTGPRHVYLKAVYNIVNAMEGLRAFDRFGFNLPTDSRRKPQSRQAEDCESWKYDPSVNDWRNSKDQRLTGYLPSAELIATLLNNIDAELD